MGKLILPPGAPTTKRQVDPRAETPEELQQRFALAASAASEAETAVAELLAAYIKHPDAILPANRAAETLASGLLSAAVKLFVAQIPHGELATPRDVIQAIRPAIEHYAELHLDALRPKQ